jgi:hypothetical protein
MSVTKPSEGFNLVGRIAAYSMAGGSVPAPANLADGWRRF